MKYEVPVWEKAALTLEEAAAYSNVGVNRSGAFRFVRRLSCQKSAKIKKEEY